MGLMGYKVIGVIVELGRTNRICLFTWDGTFDFRP